jgi:hypothetical protein
MLEMGEKAREPRAFVETCAQKLFDDDGAEAGDSDGERMPMKNRDARERSGEKQKIDQNGKIVSAEIGSEANGHF